MAVCNLEVLVLLSVHLGQNGGQVGKLLDVVAKQVLRREVRQAPVSVRSGQKLIAPVQRDAQFAVRLAVFPDVQLVLGDGGQILKKILVIGELLRFIQGRREEYLALWQVSVGRNLWGEMTDIVAGRILEQLDTQAMDPVKLAYAQLYARLFASDLMTMVKWWLEQGHIGLEQVHGMMGDNMRQGIFQAFHNYVWEKDT